MNANQESFIKDGPSIENPQKHWTYKHRSKSKSWTNYQWKILPTIHQQPDWASSHKEVSTLKLYPTYVQRNQHKTRIRRKYKIIPGGREANFSQSLCHVQLSKPGSSKFALHQQPWQQFPPRSPDRGEEEAVYGIKRTKINFQWKNKESKFTTIMQQI